MKILLKIVNHYRGYTNFYHHGKEVKTPFFCMETERPLSTSTLFPRGAREALNFERNGYVDGELNYDTAICRSCGRKFDVDYDEHSKYCPGCGQKLDWGESDE